MCATKVDFKQYGFTEQQWNSMSAKQKQTFQAQWNAWDEATKDKFRETIAKGNGSDASTALSGDAAKTENKNKGIALESSSKLSASALDAKWRAAQNTVPLEENKSLQEQKLAQYKQEYAKLYNEDPARAKEDIVDVLYAKEKYEMESAMKQMRESSDGRVALADRYLKEFADPDEVMKFTDSYGKYLEKYEDKELARQQFNSEFDLTEEDEGYIRPGMEPTERQIQMVAHRKALLDSVNIGNEDIDKMASKFLQDRYLNAAMNEVAEYDAKISEALAKGDTEKAEKLKQKAEEYLVDAKKEEIQTNAKDKEELIEMMAQAKLDREIAEERVANRQIFYSKDAPGYDKNNPNHKVLTDKMRDFVDENQEMFYDKDGNFDSEKFKEFFVRISNENETAEDGYERADYMTSIDNRKRGNREKDILSYQNELEEQYPLYKDPKTRAQFLKDNPDIADRLNYMTTKASLKDRRFQGACAEICGLDKEKDKLAGKRALHVLTSGLKGAGAGFAMGALGEAFACTKVVNKAYSGILAISGTVGYQGVQHIVQNYTHNGTVGYTHEGTVGYTHDGTVGYTHNGTVGYTHDGTVGYSHSGSVGYSGSGIADYSHTGSVGFSGSGVADYSHTGSVGFGGSGVVDYTYGGVAEYGGTLSGSVPADFTWEKWENGMLADSGTVTQDVPWSGNYSGSISYGGTGSAGYSYTGSAGYTANGQVGFDYSGSVGYTANGQVGFDYSGSVGYTANGQVGYTASGQVGYTANGQVGYTASGEVGYTASGEVGYTASGQVEGDFAYEGEAEYKTEREYEGTTSARHKFDWSVPLKAAAMGFVTGAIGGLLSMKNVKYDGGGPEIEARKKVTEDVKTPPKPIELEELPPLPVPGPTIPDITLEPIPIPPVKPPEYFDYKIEHDPGKEAPTHTIKYGENPRRIVEGRYGVEVGTKAYNEILASMLDASGYERGTNLYVGDKFVLPTVTVDGKEYKPNDDPSKVGTDPVTSKIRAAHLKAKVQYIGGAYYVVDVTDPKHPKRLTGPLSEAQAEKELERLKAEAEAAGKIQKPKDE